MELFICVHRRTEPPAGPVIDATTRIYCKPPWTFPKGPATHAFVVLQDGELWVRLDGQPPHSAVALYNPDERHNEAGWRIPLADAAAEAEVRRAFTVNTGVPYDPVELLNQLLPAMARNAGIPSARICTQVALNVLGAVPAVRQSLDLKTLFPEELADSLERVANAHPEMVTRAW